MKDYLRKIGRTPMHDQPKLVGALSAEKMLIYAPLLLWYIDHGLVIKRVHQTIDYQPKHNIFGWFVDKLTKCRRQGDIKPNEALLAEVYKLLGNFLLCVR